MSFNGPDNSSNLVVHLLLGNLQVVKNLEVFLLHNLIRRRHHMVKTAVTFNLPRKMDPWYLRFRRSKDKRSPRLVGVVILLNVILVRTRAEVGRCSQTLSISSFYIFYVDFASGGIIWLRQI